MHDTACEDRSYQEKRQPPFPPLVEDDQEHAEINPDEENAGEDAGSRAPVRDKRLQKRRQQQRCQQDQIFLLRNPVIPWGTPCSIPMRSGRNPKFEPRNWKRMTGTLGDWSDGK